MLGKITAKSPAKPEAPGPRRGPRRARKDPEYGGGDRSGGRLTARSLLPLPAFGGWALAAALVSAFTAPAGGGGAR
jgi:hypothetical protein